MSVKVVIGGDTSGAVVAVERLNQSLNKVPRVVNQSTMALTNLSRVVQDAPYGFIGIANNLNPLLESFQRLKTESGSTRGALKALGSSLTGAGGLGLAIGLVSTAVTFLTSGFGAWTRGMHEGKKAAEETKKAIDGIIESTAQEVTRVSELVEFLKQGAASTRERTAAIKELQQISPEYFGNLSHEKFSIDQLTRAYDLYTKSIQRAITAKVLEKQLMEVVEKRLTLERELNKPAMTRVLIGGRMVDAINAEYDATGRLAEKNKELVDLKKTEKALLAELVRVRPPELRIEKPVPVPKIKIKPEKIEVDPQLSDFNMIQTSAAKDFSVDIFNFKLGPQSFLKDFRERNEAQLKPIREELMRLAELGQFVGDKLASAFNGVFDALISGGNVFQALGQAIKALVVDLIKAAARMLIIKLITNAISPGLGTATSGLGGLLGALSGRAAGGPMAAGRTYLVGENGPEVFRSSTSGTMIPNNQLSGLAGSAMQMLSLSGVFRVQGRDLVYVLSQENLYQGRNG